MKIGGLGPLLINETVIGVEQTSLQAPNAFPFFMDKKE